MRWKSTWGRNVFLLALLPVLLLAWGLLLGVPRVSAAAVGTIGILGPASGPVNALVTLEVHQYPSVPTVYKLAATTISPDQGGCGSAQSVPSVAPFQVDPNRGADVQFHWPASLGKGTYWFCATSVDGSAPAAMSPPSLPYTGLTSAAPMVQVQASSSGASAGGIVTITLTNWITSDGNTPPQIALLSQGDPLDHAITVVAQPTGSGDATGVYTLTATLPGILTGGQYAIVAEGECGRDPVNTTTRTTLCAVVAQSPLFAIAPSSTLIATPTAAPTSLAANLGGGPQSQVFWIVILFGVVLLALIVGLVVILLWQASARKQQALQKQQARSARYRSGDWQEPSRYNQRYDSRDRW